jgi:hypothetical protein
MTDDKRIVMLTHLNITYQDDILFTANAKVATLAMKNSGTF